MTHATITFIFGVLVGVSSVAFVAVILIRNERARRNRLLDDLLVIRPALEAIQAFNREGLMPALFAATKVLNGEGFEKYGAQGWRGTPSSQLREKLERHYQEDRIDPDSGVHSWAHCLVRICQLLVRREEMR